MQPGNQSSLDSWVVWLKTTESTKGTGKIWHLTGWTNKAFGEVTWEGWMSSLVDVLVKRTPDERETRSEDCEAGCYLENWRNTLKASVAANQRLQWKQPYWPLSRSLRCDGWTWYLFVPENSWPEELRSMGNAAGVQVSTEWVTQNAWDEKYFRFWILEYFKADNEISWG